MAVPIEACQLDVEGPLPDEPQRIPCPKKPEGYVGDWPDLEVCYTTGEAWKLRALVKILVDVYRDAVACERASKPASAR